MVTRAKTNTKVMGAGSHVSYVAALQRRLNLWVAPRVRAANRSARENWPIPFSRLADLWSRWRTSYWFVPTIMVLCAIGLAIGALRLDLLLASSLSDLMPWFGGMGTEAARKS